MKLVFGRPKSACVRFAEHMRDRSFFYFILSLLLSCGEPDFLEGYNRHELFATPTQQEIEAVTADWKSRDLTPRDYQVEHEVEITDRGTILKIVSFTVNDIKEYGALIVPRTESPVPVRMFIFGFGINETTYAIHLELDDTSFDKPFIFAVPALRGQSLAITVNGAEYTTPVSEGQHCDAFDGATDDAIAFLNQIESTEEMADVSRVAVRGGSRGGTVALLMAERDKRVKLAVDVAGPTNMLELTSVSENDLTYQCQFLDALVNGTSTVKDTRHTMIASSPVFFAQDLPKTQLHLGAKDRIVPVSQGDQMLSKMNEIGLPQLIEMFVYADRGHADIASDNQELSERIEAFLAQL